MYDFPLTGAQRTFLRGLGQRLAPAIKDGKGGLSPAFYTELQKILRVHELVKVRFLGADREARAARCMQITDEGRCVFVGAVGHTALFYRQHPEPAGRRITLP
ncbi:MAG: YhbY family RNA-binding protein [Opitutaceae bacterium]|nr:YhbY family RNA-binding protein [Opitutaceae bacterium]